MSREQDQALKKLVAVHVGRQQKINEVKKRLLNNKKKVSSNTNPGKIQRLKR